VSSDRLADCMGVVMYVVKRAPDDNEDAYTVTTPFTHARTKWRSVRRPDDAAGTECSGPFLLPFNASL